MSINSADRSKTMAGSRLVEQFRICEGENKLLKEKLHIHFDRWGFERQVLEESALRMAKEHGLKSAQQTYELAQANLLRGVQTQQNLVQKYHLELARDEVEVMNQEVLGLKFAFQHEKVKKKFMHDKMKMMKSALQKRFISRTKAFVEEARKKFQQSQELLKSRQHSYVEAVNKLSVRHSADTMQLNGRLQLLMSETGVLKKGQEQWKLDREELQILAVEKHKLQAELEKLQSILEERNRILVDKEQELQLLADDKDRLLTELERWDLQHKENQVLREEMDKLWTEKECWAVKEDEMRRLAAERDNLLLQRDEWISKEKDIQQLTIERDQLKRKVQGRESDEFYKRAKERDKLLQKLDQVQSQREEEVKGLMRERDFVWGQMKKIEDDYTQRLNTVSGQFIQANQEIVKLKDDLQQARLERNEKMVELTILKLQAKQAEEHVTELKESVATSKKVSNPGGANDLCSEFTKSEDEERKTVLELTSQIEILQRQLDAYKNQNQGGVCAPSKEKPEVLNAEDILISDHDTFVSQVEQATIVDREDEIRTSKIVEELRRENENLRVLYGQLEALYKEQQKPEKVVRNVSRRDPTSRNLKFELEAAAASTPSDVEPVPDSMVGKLNRRGRGSKTRGSKRKSAQKTTVKELSSESQQELTSTAPERWGSSVKKDTSSIFSTRNTSSSKPPLPSSSKRGGKLDRLEDGSTKKISRRKSVGEGLKDTLSLRVEHDEDDLPRRSTRKRKVDIAGLEEAQKAPLQPVPVSEGKKTSVRKSKQNSERKPERDSPDYKTISSAKGSRGLMADLFSSAFSIPRLNFRSSSVTRTGHPEK